MKEQPNTQDWEPINWDKLREEFFQECTEYHSVKHDRRVVNLTPHNLFNWFKSRLSSTDKLPYSRIKAFIKRQRYIGEYLFGDKIRKRYNKTADEFYKQFADEVFYRKDGVECGLDIQTLWYFRTNDMLKEESLSAKTLSQGSNSVMYREVKCEDRLPDSLRVVIASYDDNTIISQVFYDEENKSWHWAFTDPEENSSDEPDWWLEPIPSTSETKPVSEEKPLGFIESSELLSTTQPKIDEGWVSIKDAMPPLAPAKNCIYGLPFSDAVLVKNGLGEELDGVYDFTERSWIDPEYEYNIEHSEEIDGKAEFDHKITHWKALAKLLNQDK